MAAPQCLSSIFLHLRVTLLLADCGIGGKYWTLETRRDIILPKQLNSGLYTVVWIFLEFNSFSPL